MKLKSSNHSPSVAARASFVSFVFFVVAQSCVALASASEPMLTHAWRAEATRPAEVAITLRQGETLRLECTLLERAKPITPPNDASARFFWRDADAKGTYWTAPAKLQGNVLSFDWSPARDTGKRRYDFFLSVESPTAGSLYRASGVLILQPSPGFNPADLEAPDVFAEVVDRVSSEVKGWADATYQPKGDYLTTEADPTVSAEAQAREAADAALQGALSAEAQTREEADSAITQAVNALQDDLSTHNHDGAYLKLTGGTMSGTILSALSKASDPGLTITLGQGDRYYAKHTQAGIQARRALSDPEEFYAFFSVSGTNQIARLGDLEPLATKAALAAKAEATHNHEMGDVDGLETALASKAALDHTHSQYLTSYTESDPTIAAWAKAATKPTYNWTEILNKPTTFTPATHNHDGTYLKLTGGTVTGNVTFGEDKESSSAARADLVLIQDNSASNLGGRLIFKEEGWLDQAAMFATWASTGGQGDSNRFNIGTATGGTGTTLATTFTPRLSILFSSGNVGIGTNSPNEKLHVSGNVRANAFNEGGVLLSNKYAAKTHSHAINEVTNLQAALDAKAPATHTHAMADTEGLVEAIAEAAAPTGVATANAIAYQKASLLVVTPDAEGAITWSLDTWPEGGQLVIRLTTGSATPTLPDWAHLLGYADLQPGSIYTLQAWRYGQKLYLNPVLRETIEE